MYRHGVFSGMDEAKEVTDIFALSSPAHYLKCFNLFQKKSGQLEKNAEILQEHIPPIIQRMIPDSVGQTLNILSAGSGDGKIDLMILKLIEEELRKSNHDRHMKIFNRAIEPNKYMCDLYKAVIENLPSSPDDRNTKFEIRQQTFKEYQGSQKGATKFDIIHFVHSIYYVDIEQTLLYCFEKELCDKGYVICIVDFEGIISPIFLRQIRLWPVEDAVRKGHETAEKLITIADENGWKHEVYTHVYELDVTDVFDPRSTEGNLLLDFLTQTVNYREVADKKLVEETLALIKDLSIERDGKNFGEKKESLIIMYK